MLPVLLAIETGLDVTRNAAGYSGTADVTVIVGRAIQVMLEATGIVFVLLLIYGGITWMVAQGDKNKIETAHRILTNSTIALVVIVAAYAIAQYVIQALTYTVS
jgi:hypothetical protein